MTTRSRLQLVGLAAVTLLVLTGCQWRGANSLPLPGTAGNGPGAYVVQAQLADVSAIQQNSRVRVGDVTVGNVVKVERQGWNALVTMSLDADVQLPANATATVGQTSLLGSTHIELAPPTSVPPEGRLGNGAVIPMAATGSYPTTEQTLSALSLLLNGGGIGQIQDITRSLATAFNGREADVRALIGQLNTFVEQANDQTDDIIAATSSLNALVAQFAQRKPVLDRALEVIPHALTVLSDRRDQLTEALDQLGRLGAVTASSVDQTKESLTKILNELGPVFESLANAGPALTRSLSEITTFPFPKEQLPLWLRGDYANATLIVDLTLSRIDQGFFTGTRFEGDLTELEMKWGRTIGQIPSPTTNVNPLIIPYRTDQGR